MLVLYKKIVVGRESKKGMLIFFGFDAATEN